MFVFSSKTRNLQTLKYDVLMTSQVEKIPVFQFSEYLFFN